MRSISQTSTPMPAITGAPPPSARPAGVTGVGVAGRRLELGVRLPPLGDEVALLDAVVDEIPWQQLAGAVRAVHEAVGIDQVLPSAAQRAQHGPPRLWVAVEALEELGHATVAARQQRLEVSLAGTLGLDLHGGDRAELPPHARQLALERREILHRLPLERRPRLGHEGVDRDQNAADLRP